MLLVTGFWLVVAGLVFGVPTGAVYHVALHRALRRADDLPPRWWWNPTAHHHRLPPGDRFRVLAWCGAGALGFLIAVLGCVVGAVGAFRLL